jgi:hypothetical protein
VHRSFNKEPTMYEIARTLRAQETHSWTWNLVPLLIVAVALTGLLIPQGDADPEAAATEPARAEAPGPFALLVPSPQPGMGEPELVPAELPQSY